MTLAALESTLRLYRDEASAIEAIPTLRMLLMPLDTITARAQQLTAQLQQPGEVVLEDGERVDLAAVVSNMDSMCPAGEGSEDNSISFKYLTDLYPYRPGMTARIGRP